MKSETALERMLMVWRTPQGMIGCADGRYLFSRIDDVDTDPMFIWIEDERIDVDLNKVCTFDDQCRFLGPIPTVQ